MTDFYYEASLPDPEATDVRHRKQGTVTGKAPDGTIACSLDFGLTGDDVIVNQVETGDPYKQRGCAEGLLDHLIEQYGQVPIDGPQENTADGEPWVERMVERGKLRR